MLNFELTFTKYIATSAVSGSTNSFFSVVFFPRFVYSMELFGWEQVHLFDYSVDF